MNKMKTYTIRTDLTIEELNDLTKGKCDIAEWEKVTRMMGETMRMQEDIKILLEGVNELNKRIDAVKEVLFKFEKELSVFEEADGQRFIEIKKELMRV